MLKGPHAAKYGGSTRRVRRERHHRSTRTFVATSPTKTLVPYSLADIVAVASVRLLTCTREPPRKKKHFLGGTYKASQRNKEVRSRACSKSDQFSERHENGVHALKWTSVPESTVEYGPGKNVSYQKIGKICSPPSKTSNLVLCDKPGKSTTLRKVQ